jgi:hypothetical protein
MSFLDLLGRELEVNNIVAFIAYNIGDCSSPTIKIGKIVKLDIRKKYKKSFFAAFCCSISLAEKEDQITQWVPTANTLLLDGDMINTITLSRLTVSEVGKQINLNLIPIEMFRAVAKEIRALGYKCTTSTKDYKQTIVVSLSENKTRYAHTKEFDGMCEQVEAILAKYNLPIECLYSYYGKRYLLNP